MARVVLENVVKTYPGVGQQAAFAAVKGINLEGDFGLLDKIDTSHRFLYGHRYWKTVKAAIEAEAAVFSDQTPSLADEIRAIAAMVAEKGQGSFTIRNGSGTTVARLGEGIGGGLLQIANGEGFAMVEAGIHPSGVGLVRAFPVRSPGAGMVGMPGTFLIGRPGGE